MFREQFPFFVPRPPIGQVEQDFQSLGFRTCAVGRPHAGFPKSRILCSGPCSIIWEDAVLRKAWLHCDGASFSGSGSTYEAMHVRP